MTNWAPRAIAGGLTHFANVVSAESLAASSAKSMALGLEGQLQMDLFSDIDEAKQWLREAQQHTGSTNSEKPRCKRGFSEFDIALLYRRSTRDTHCHTSHLTRRGCLELEMCRAVGAQ